MLHNGTLHASIAPRGTYAFSQVRIDVWATYRRYWNSPSNKNKLSQDMLIGAHWHQVMTYMEYTKWTHWKGIYKPNYLGFAAVSCKRRRRPCGYPLCSMEPICQRLKYDEHVSSFVLELQPITGSSPEKEMYCAPFTVTCFICGPTDLASLIQRCRTQLWAKPCNVLQILPRCKLNTSLGQYVVFVCCYSRPASSFSRILDK